MNTPVNNEDVVKIIKVKLKNKKDKYEVTFLKDQEEAKVILLEDQIVNFRILKDKEFSLDEWNDILSTSNVSLWLGKTINYLSFKNRTIKEVKDYLVAGELTKKQSDEIINRLINMRLLNDEEYAVKYLDEVIRKKKGLKYFKYQLQQKGVLPSIINKVALNYPEDLIVEDLIEAVQKEQKKLYTYPINLQKQKLTDKLLRDGFSNNVIAQVFNNISWEYNITQRIQKDIEKLKSKTNDYNRITQKLIAKGYSYQDIKKFLNK